MTDASEEKFACQMMDILEKKELEVLRQGAKETAKSYSCERIAQEAVMLYAEAIRLRRGKAAFPSRATHLLRGYGRT